MNSVHPFIKARESRRIIDPDRPVEKEKLDAIFEAARWAPSCSNNQPWRFVLTTGSRLTDLKKALTRGNAWAKKAPVIITVVSAPDLDCRIRGRDYYLLGVGTALENLLLQGIYEGLVVHPVAGFDEHAVRAVLGIPERYTIHTLVIVGYPGDPAHADEETLVKERKPRVRRPLESMVFEEVWKTQDP